VKCCAATFVLLLAFAFVLQSPAQQKTPVAQPQADEVLRVSTNLVTIPVTVRTRQGTFVPNLRREDFRVYEDGIEQDIASFESVAEPFTIILMLDASDSTRIKLQEIQAAAIAFLKQLRPEDRAVIVSFDKQVSVLTAATGDRDVLARAIYRVQTGGGTALYDALENTITELLKKIPGRKAVVLLTDGVDTASTLATYQSTLHSAAEQYELIYALQYDTPNDVRTRSGSELTYTTPSGESLSKAYERATRYLQSLARNSGGRFQYSDSVKHLEVSFARIAEELRQQYSLSYYPNNPNPKAAKRQLKVALNLPGAAVHARASYVYKPDRP
jgi:Ca-activated chloride channel family protein